MPETSAPVSELGWVSPGQPSGAGILELIPGGIVLPFIAGGNLNVGDAVHISADKTVNKTAVVGDHNKRMGIVVGGDRLAPTGAGGTVTKQGLGEVIWDITQYNVARQAGQAGDLVWVLNVGISYVVTDSALAAGVPIKESIVTAGQVGPSAAAQVNLGNLLEASSGAGQVKLALIELS